MSEPDSGLDGKTAIVTGAGSGIGQATATLLDRAGATVIAADLDPDAARRTAAGGRQMHAESVDVRDEQSVIALIDHARAIGGRLDMLVNVAGIGSTTPATGTPLDVWENVFAVNARGTFLCCKHALGPMIAQGGGVIVNMGSVAGLVGLPNRAAYCASKGAVLAFTRALAVDHVGDGVRVNCVCPGRSTPRGWSASSTTPANHSLSCAPGSRWGACARPRRWRRRCSTSSQTPAGSSPVARS